MRRPKWALTEGEAQQAEEKEEEREVSDLLDFAKGLDFDRCATTTRPPNTP